MYNLAEDNYNQHIKEGKVFVQVWSKDCGWCDKQKPVLDKVSASYPDVKFMAINIDYTKRGEQQKPSAFRDEHLEGRDGAPVLLVFQDGKMVGRAYKALLSENILKKFIEEPTIEKVADLQQAKPMNIEEYCAKASVIELKASISDERDKIDQAQFNINLFRQELARRQTK